MGYEWFRAKKVRQAFFDCKRENIKKGRLEGGVIFFFLTNYYFFKMKVTLSLLCAGLWYSSCFSFLSDWGWRSLWDDVPKFNIFFMIIWNMQNYLNELHKHFFNPLCYVRIFRAITHIVNGIKWFPYIHKAYPYFCLKIFSVLRKLSLKKGLKILPFSNFLNPNSLLFE